MNAKAKNEWVRDGLTRRGYRQKDLAVAWGSQQASVSRFFAGEELQDLPLSKAVSLARMLGITIDELAKGLGHNGIAVEPTVEVAKQEYVPLGTFNIETPRPGVTRIMMRKDMSLAGAMKVFEIVSGDVLPE